MTKALDAALADIGAGLPHHLLGQTLARDELPASLHTITPDMQRALLHALNSDRLDWHGRQGWHASTSRLTPPIGDATIGALHARDLVVIVSRGKFKKHCRISERGQWFARTINSRLLARVGKVLAK